MTNLPTALTINYRTRNREQFAGFIENKTATKAHPKTRIYLEKRGRSEWSGRGGYFVIVIETKVYKGTRHGYEDFNKVQRSLKVINNDRLLAFDEKKLAAKIEEVNTFAIAESQRVLDEANWRLEAKQKTQDVRAEYEMISLDLEQKNVTFSTNSVDFKASGLTPREAAELTRTLAKLRS